MRATKTAKQEVIELLDLLPEDSSFDTIMAEIYFKMQVQVGLDDIKAGRVVSHEEIEKEFEGPWRESSGH